MKWQFILFDTQAFIHYTPLTKKGIPFTVKPKLSLFKLLKHWQSSFFLTFLLGGIFWFWIARNSPATAWDFTEFYIAGNIPVSSLYEQNVFVAYGNRALLPIGIGYYLPYISPAVFTIPLKLMMWLPYWIAYCA